MLRCDLCKHRIDSGDDYAKGDDKIICMDCLADYIMENYDVCDIAKEFGFSIRECEEEQEEEKEQPIPGQMDMFGGVVGGW